VKLLVGLLELELGLLEVWEIEFIVWELGLCDFIEIMAKFGLIVLTVQQWRFKSQIEIMIFGVDFSYENEYWIKIIPSQIVCWIWASIWVLQVWVYVYKWIKETKELET